MITTQVSGAREAAKAFLNASSVAAGKTSAIVAYHGKIYQGKVKRRASGRPGPNIITKKYHDSIGFRMTQSGAGVSAFIGSDAPQSRRLELGFTGVDSLNRSYDQPPYPHFEPDLQDTADAIQRSVAAMVAIDFTNGTSVSITK